MKWLSDKSLKHLLDVANDPDFGDTKYRIVEEISRGGMGTAGMSSVFFVLPQMGKVYDYYKAQGGELAASQMSFRLVAVLPALLLTFFLTILIQRRVEVGLESLVEFFDLIGDKPARDHHFAGHGTGIGVRGLILVEQVPAQRAQHGTTGHLHDGHIQLIKIAKPRAA